MNRRFCQLKYVANGTCASSLASGFLTLPRSWSYETLKGAAMLKNGGKSRLSHLKTVLPENSPWSPRSAHWALAPWNQHPRIEERKGRLDRLRRCRARKERREGNKGTLGSHTLGSADASWCFSSLPGVAWTARHRRRGRNRLHHSAGIRCSE